MLVHEIKTKNSDSAESIVFNIVYSKNQNPFWEELPKYIMLYLDMAYEKKYFFTLIFLESLRP